MRSGPERIQKFYAAAFDEQRLIGQICLPYSDTLGFKVYQISGFSKDRTLTLFVFTMYVHG